MPTLEANLQSIARGGVAELFERELQRVVENVKDPNTDPKKKRSIKVTFSCTPYADRSGFNIDVSVEAKLQSPNGVTGTVYIGKEAGRFRAYTQDIQQGDLFDADKGEVDDDQPTPPDRRSSAVPN